MKKEYILLTIILLLVTANSYSETRIYPPNDVNQLINISQYFKLSDSETVTGNTTFQGNIAVTGQVDNYDISSQFGTVATDTTTIANTYLSLAGTHTITGQSYWDNYVTVGTTFTVRNGRVGIGTSSPVSNTILNIIGNTKCDFPNATTTITGNYNSLEITNSNQTNNNFATLGFSDTAALGGGTGAVIGTKFNAHGAGSYDTELHFVTRKVDTFRTILRLDSLGGMFVDASAGYTTGNTQFQVCDTTLTVSGGNVGIGTTDPQALLNVARLSGDTASAVIRLDQNNAASGGNYSLAARNTGDFGIYDNDFLKDRITINSGSGNSIVFYSSASIGQEGMKFNTQAGSGVYVIFTSSYSGTSGSEPTIEPSEHNYGSLGMSGRAWWRGYASSWVSQSARKDKTDIRLMSNQDKNILYDKVKTLKLNKYRLLKNGVAKNESFGLIADESPVEIVDEGGEGIKLYEYTSLLLGALQNAQAKIDDLESRIAVLEKK